MSLTLTLLMDPADVEKFTAYLEGMKTRAERGPVMAKLLEAFAPVAAAEQAFLRGGGHVISGALVSSLTARAGGVSRDNPGTISVFSAPTATTRMLMKTWRVSRRKQQREWTLKEKLSARQRVFYGPIVHQGHGNASPIPFASSAMDELGEQQAEVASESILELIVNGV